MKSFNWKNHLSKTVFVIAGSLSICGAAHAAVLTEDFEAAFPAWESGWLGTNSNLANYYTGASGGSTTNRGNNPDGLWINDADGVFGGDLSVDIAFNNLFGSSLTSLFLDVAGYVPANLQIYDISGSVLLDVNPLALTGGATTDPGTYVNYGTTSSNGIGGFRFIPTSGSQIEGNTSIDNVVVNVGLPVDPPSNVPAPATLALFGLGLLGLRLSRK